MRLPGPGSDPDHAERIATCARSSIPTSSSRPWCSVAGYGGCGRPGRSGAVIPIVCRETVRELLRVLAYPKFRLTAAEREVLLGDYLPFAEVAHLPDPPPELPTACRDHSDAVFIQLAIASRAEMLVSGDEDLTVLATAYPVASPAMLHRLLAGG